MGETEDTLVGVVHGHGDSFTLKVVNGQLGRGGSIGGGEGEGEFTGTRGDVVGRSVLMSVGFEEGEGGRGFALTWSPKACRPITMG